MLGSKKAVTSVSGGTTLISKDAEIVGDISFSGNLDIEGHVTGNIVAVSGKDALVRVIDKGCVQGEIRAPSVMINGRVEGSVHASKHLELAAKASVAGDVYYTLVEMAVGAEVNGSMTHVDASDAKIKSGEQPEKPALVKVE